MGSKIRQSGDLCLARGVGRPDYCGVKIGPAIHYSLPSSVPNSRLKAYFALAKRTRTNEEKLADGDGAGYSSAWQW